MTLRWWNPVSWLIVPLIAVARAMRHLFPFTREGRQTLVYLVFAGAGPALTGLVIWAMVTSLGYRLFGTFTNLAYIVAACLLIIVTGLAMFVSLRAVKLGKDGFEASGGEEAPAAARAVADAADKEASAIEDAATPLPDAPEYKSFADEPK